MNSRELLERLVAFPTVSRNSNLELIEFVQAFLCGLGASCQMVRDQSARKANLYATLGPRDKSGIMLSGHTDVVPVDGQAWAGDPFALRQRGDRLYARGSADMKGFLACALAAAERAANRRFAVPLHLAFSYDEEVGCLGVRSLIDAMGGWAQRPHCCIVGEPTLLQTAIGHKGKTALKATCRGHAAHSANPAKGINAIQLASKLVGCVEALQAEVAANGRRDSAYEVPYTTLHVGVIAGGTSVNIVPDCCEIDLEIRNLEADDPARLIDRLREDGRSIVAASSRQGMRAEIELEVMNAYPALDTPADAAVVAMVASLTGQRETFKVAFGTEGGLFSDRLGIPSIVCGPGSIDQAHKPDEFIAVDQMQRCDRLLDALIERLI